MRTIVQDGDPVLRASAAEVLVGDITSPKIKKIIAEMKEVLATQDDGIAIAAPQIGVSLQIFLVSGRVLKLADKEYEGSEDDLIFINPKITKLSRGKQEVEEGCLSVRWKYGLIERAEKATIRAYDEQGKLFERGASGLLAQVFQHETDHLIGVLFIDNAYNIKDMPPEDTEDEIKRK